MQRSGALRLPTIPALLIFAGCVMQPAETEPAATAPPVWRAGTAEHVALWLHGLAQLLPATSDSTVLPLYRTDYVADITAEKRRRGVYPTTLDRRADELRALLRAEPLRALDFLPLYFEDDVALFGALRLWRETEGDARRAGSEAGARVVGFLSSLFPRTAQRRAVTELGVALELEAREFHHAYWQARLAELQRSAGEFDAEWARLAPRLAQLLDYLQLEGGEVLLVPALATEGRTVTRGAGQPRVALGVQANAADAVHSFLHELMYSLVGDVMREHVAPARLREIGEEVLATRAAVRAGAMALDSVAPERAAEYRRFYLRAVGRTPAPNRASAEFAAAFPLPDDLERGLADAVRQALAGI